MLAESYVTLRGTSPSKKLIPVRPKISGVKRPHRLLCPWPLPLLQVMRGDEALSTLSSMKLTVFIIFLVDLSHFLELLFFSDYSLAGTLGIELRGAHGSLNPAFFS